MSIFSGLEKMGLGDFKDVSVLDEKKESTTTDGAPKAVEIKEADILFDKRYTCPVCERNFTSKCVRAGKIKNIGKDTDLRPIYEIMDPLKYDAVTCDRCGYSAITRYFGKLSDKQISAIRQQVGTSFTGIDNNKEVFSYDDAIDRYKLALLCSVIKHSKNSERAYTCLKMAWVFRGKRLLLDEKNPEIKGIYENELECLKNAYETFMIALQTESFPIAGMDEHVLKYVLADIARRLKRYDEASKLISLVITSRATPSRLKDQALMLKETIKEEMKKANPL